MPSAQGFPSTCSPPGSPLGCMGHPPFDGSPAYGNQGFKYQKALIYGLHLTPHSSVTQQLSNSRCYLVERSVFPLQSSAAGLHDTSDSRPSAPVSPSPFWSASADGAEGRATPLSAPASNGSLRTTDGERSQQHRPPPASAVWSWVTGRCGRISTLKIWHGGVPCPRSHFPAAQRESCGMERRRWAEGQAGGWG